MTLKANFLTATTVAATLAVGTIALPGVAEAATMSFNSNPLNISVIGDTAITPKVTPVSLQKFNSALGTLNSITLQLSGPITNIVGVENEQKLTKNKPTRTVSASSTTTVIFRAFAPGGSISSGLDTLNNFVSKDAETYDGLSDFAGTSGASNSASTNLSAFNTYTLKDILDQFIGSGTFNGFVNIRSNSTRDPLFNVNVDNRVNAQVVASVIYDYTPIPTPALLPGLIGLGAAALRKRKQEAKQEADA